MQPFDRHVWIFRAELDKDQPSTRLQSAADGLYCLQCTSADEDRKQPEEPLLAGIQQVVTPLERVTQRLLPSR